MKNTFDVAVFKESMRKNSSVVSPRLSSVLVAARRQWHGSWLAFNCLQQWMKCSVHVPCTLQLFHHLLDGSLTRMG